ncbi:MAG: GerAB/ArcD/ProY family transporter [Acidobacteriota bacterium]
METGKISQRQLLFIIILTALSPAVFFVPQVAARAVAQDAWIPPLIAGIWSVLNVMVIFALAKRYPGATIIEYLPMVLGKPLGKFFALLYTLWYFSVSSFALRSFGIFLNVSVMPETPILAFTVTMLLLSFYAIRNGLESWARVNEIIGPLVLLAIVGIAILPMGFADFRRLLPVGEHSMGQLIVPSFIQASMRGQLIVACMFIPALASLKNATRNFSWTILAVGLIPALLNFSAIVVFGGVNMGILEFPIYSLARIIDVARIINRLELILVIAWVMGSFTLVTTFAYCSVRATTQLLGFKDYQRLLFPVAVVILALSDNIWQNMARFMEFVADAWGGYGLLSFELVIPSVILLISVLRKHRVEGTA